MQMYNTLNQLIHGVNLQTILFFKAFNSLILVMYRLQFHRFISECFPSNFVLFLNERDGLSKWAPT